MLDTIIRNGKIVTDSHVYEAEIGIQEGKITNIARNISESANKEIDASGKLVMPGLIDGHTHMEMPFMGTVSNDDFEVGTTAAVCGGVTTVVDFALQPRGDNILNTYQQWRKKADPKVTTDYALHMIIRDYNEESVKQIKQLIDEGVMSFKLFMAYSGELMLNDFEIFNIMNEVGKHGGMVGMHCENGHMIECLASRFLSEGKIQAEYHAKSRPHIVEAEAVNRAISIAAVAKSPMYVVHMSTGLARDEIADGRRKGLPVYSETCPHYLTFTDEMYKRPDGNHYIMSPPLRFDEDRTKMWQGLAEGLIQTVASDHVCFSAAQKAQEDFTKVPNGVIGTEVILAVLYDGVRKGLLPLPRLAAVGSYNPAKLFGLFPQKGVIAVGSDADLVIFDPEKRQRLSVDNLHSNIEYSIYEDVTVTGYPVMTFSRGEMVHQDGQFTGKKGSGKFTPGKRLPEGRPQVA